MTPPALPGRLSPSDDPRGAFLAPITYQAAYDLYRAGGRAPFSFIAAPYGVVKTIMVEGGAVVAAAPAPAYRHYGLVMVAREARSLRDKALRRKRGRR